MSPGSYGNFLNPPKGKLMQATAALFPPRVRAVIYLLTVMLAAAYAVAVAKTDIVWQIEAAYAAWNAGAATLAVSNTSTTPPE